MGRSPAGEPGPTPSRRWSPTCAGSSVGRSWAGKEAATSQETIRRQLACELGPHGVRVITIVTGGIPETIGADVDPGIAQGIVDATMIGRAATYEDLGRVAVLAASDHARMMTAATLNISGGAVID